MVRPDSTPVHCASIVHISMLPCSITAHWCDSVMPAGLMFEPGWTVMCECSECSSRWITSPLPVSASQAGLLQRLWLLLLWEINDWRMYRDQTQLAGGLKSVKVRGETLNHLPA